MYIQSIYAGQLTESSAESSGFQDPDQVSRRIDIKLDVLFSHPTTVRLKEVNNSVGTEQDQKATDVVCLATSLPPLCVSIELSAGYPLKRPPRLVDIQTWKPSDASIPTDRVQRVHAQAQHHREHIVDRFDHCYLHESIIATIKDKLASLWSEAGDGDTILWNWFEWVSSGEFLCAESSVVDLPTISPQSLLNLIRSHERAIRTQTFNTTFYDCGICLERKKGRDCVRFEVEEGGCGCVL